MFSSRTGSCVGTLSKNLSEILFPVFTTFFAFLSKTGPVKSLFKETCLDLELRNKKPVRQPVFCRQVAEARITYL